MRFLWAETGLFRGFKEQCSKMSCLLIVKIHER